jgi:hypothetical protein
MGHAKARGTFDERRAEAIRRGPDPHRKKLISTKRRWLGREAGIGLQKASNGRRYHYDGKMLRRIP